MRWLNPLCLLLGHRTTLEPFGHDNWRVHCKRCGKSLTWWGPPSGSVLDYPEGFSQQAASDGSHTHGSSIGGKEQRGSGDKGTGGAE